MIQVIPLKQGSQEWIDWRIASGIGGSENGSVLGINDYADVFTVFQEKVGLTPPRKVYSEAAFWGKKSENPVADSWEFFDGKYDEFHIPTYVRREENYLREVELAKSRGEKVDRSKYILRSCRKAKGVIVNTDYPWLFLSPDRLIMPNQKRLSDGSNNPKHAYLEIKQINYFHAKQYESSIPPEHESQVIQGMIVLGVDYAELAVLSDGNRLKVIPYEWNQEYVDKLLEVTHEFWYGNVLPARDVYTRIRIAEQSGDPIRIIEDLWAEFHNYEPIPSDEENFAKYVLKTRQVETGKSMIGDETMKTLAKNYNAVNAMTNILGKVQTKFKNAIIDHMTRNGVDEIHFDGDGWIRNRPNKNSATPTFKVSDKIWPYEFKVAEQLGGIDFETIYEEDQE